jgi:hypothetical protein
MKVELKRLGIARTGLVLGMFYGLIILITGPLMILLMVMRPPEQSEEVFGALLAIFIYPLIGFIVGIITAAFYNLVARASGGLILEMDVEPIHEQTESCA